MVHGALFGVVFVILPGLAGEGTPPSARGAALNTFGPGADAARVRGPWGLGPAASTWRLGGALVAAGAVAPLGAVAYLGLRRRGPAAAAATSVPVPAA